MSHIERKKHKKEMFVHKKKIIFVKKKRLDVFKVL